MPKFDKQAEELEQFRKKLVENPYIEDVQTEILSEITKGQQLFEFNQDWLKTVTKKKKKSSKIIEEDFSIGEEDDDDFDEQNGLDFSLDDEDEELKF